MPPEPDIAICVGNCCCIHNTLITCHSIVVCINTSIISAHCCVINTVLNAVGSCYGSAFGCCAITGIIYCAFALGQLLMWPFLGGGIVVVCTLGPSIVLGIPCAVAGLILWGYAKRYKDLLYFQPNSKSTIPLEKILQVPDMESGEDCSLPSPILQQSPQRKTLPPLIQEPPVPNISTTENVASKVPSTQIMEGSTTSPPIKGMGSTEGQAKSPKSTPRTPGRSPRNSIVKSSPRSPRHVMSPRLPTFPRIPTEEQQVDSPV